MTERIIILGMPGDIDNTSIPEYYGIFITDPEEKLKSDLEEIVSWSTMDDLYDTLYRIESQIERHPALAIHAPADDQHPLERLISAAAVNSNDPYSMLWLKSFVGNLIHASVSLGKKDGMHFVFIVDYLGAILVKTNEIQTLDEAYSNRLAWLRHQFSATVRTDISDQCVPRRGRRPDAAMVGRYRGERYSQLLLNKPNNPRRLDKGRP